jgi:vitamin B12 transporter
MKYLFVLLLLAASIYAYAEEKGYDIGEIVVTSERFEESVEDVGSSVSVVTDTEIEEKGNISVSDILRDIPGISLVRNGGVGGYTSMFIRGAESSHALVMIDGVEMNDPMSPARSFDWANLLTGDIERIEIVRGPQSTLYGSDAMGGVVNIITKQGKGKPVIGGLFEGGSFYTFRESIYSRGAFSRGDYSVSLSRLDSKGFSAAALGDEKDGYNNTTFNAKVDVDLYQKLKWYGNLRYLEAWSELDNGAFGDDPNFSMDTTSLSGKTGIEHSLTDWWKYDLNFSWLNLHRDDRNAFDEFHLFDDSKDWFDGVNYKGDWQNTINLGDISTLVGGVEYQSEQGKSFSRMTSLLGEFISEFPKKTADTIGVYIQDTIKLWERLIVTFGGRYEDHEIFGSHTDYKAWASYRIPKIDTRLKGSIGTGFKAPSLFQLYSIYGSTDLVPEEAMSYDIGFDQPLFEEKITTGITYFHNDFSDLIDWDDSLWKYRNISKAKTQGVEAALNWKIFKWLDAGVTYTYLHTEDKTTGLELDRRPMHTYGLAFKWYPTEKYIVRLDLLHVGERKDIDYSNYPYEQITLNGYTKVDLSLHYKIRPSIEFFGRIENLLDEKYEEVYGFNSAGIAGYGGIKAEF